MIPHSELRGLVGGLRVHEPLSRHTTIGVGGVANYFFSPEQAHDLKLALDLCRDYGLPYIVFGGGSNVLFPDSGYPGMVISTDRLRDVRIGDGWVEAAAGVFTPALLTLLNQAGERSLNFLAGIPGSLGGAIVMNAGPRGISIGDRVDTVTVVDERGLVRKISGGDFCFSYRTSLARDTRLIVIEARLRLDGEPYDLKGTIAAKRANQPLDQLSSGCIFKNPPGDSAGRLIEQVGLKGFRLEKAKVSEKHANFILNLGGASYAEIRKLIDIVREKVYKSLHILLELEVEVIDE